MKLIKHKIAHELKRTVSEINDMDAEEFDDWFLYFKYIQEETGYPTKGKGKASKGNSPTTTYY